MAELSTWPALSVQAPGALCLSVAAHFADEPSRECAGKRALDSTRRGPPRGGAVQRYALLRRPDSSSRAVAPSFAPCTSSASARTSAAAARHFYEPMGGMATAVCACDRGIHTYRRPTPDMAGCSSRVQRHVL